MNKFKIVVKIFDDKTREASLYKRVLWFKLFWFIKIYRWLHYSQPHRSYNDYEISINSVLVIYWYDLYDPTYKCYQIAKKIGGEENIIIEVKKLNRDFKTIVKVKLRSLKEYEEFN